MSMNLSNSITSFLLLEEGRITACDTAALDMFQCDRNVLMDCDFFSVFSAPVQLDGRESEQVIKDYISRALADEPQYFTWRFRRADRSVFDTEISLKKRVFRGLTCLMAVIIDINEKSRINEALLVQKSYFQQLFENAPEAIVIANGIAHILNINKSFEKFFQYSYQEAVGRHLHDLIVPEDKLEEARDALERVSRGEKPRGETIRRRKDGSFIHVAYSTFPVVFNNQSVGYYIIYTDITARKEAEEKLKYISLHDSLTGLYNRTFFEQKMLELQENPPEKLGMIVCDIDGLKIINDTLGHNTGDQLLINTGNILSECLAENDILCRIGGDEFVIILPGYNKESIDSLIDRIRVSIDEYNNSAQIPINISIGYSYREENSDLDTKQLFVEADNYMYRDKLHRGKSARSAIVQTLMTALEARDFITEGHAERMQTLVTKIAEALNLSDKTINELRLLGQFHDIGKVGIPDSILFKPGPLTQEEQKIIQRHSEIGARIAQSAPDLAPISDWILRHHEWWNGEGYPFGLKGEEIPLECRILAIADTYDSMTSDRPYRKALPHEAAIAEIKRCSGTQFDPVMVEKCLPVLEKYYQESKQ